MRLDADRLTAAIEAGFDSAHAPRVIEILLALAIALQLWSIVRTATESSTIAVDSVLSSQSLQPRVTQFDVSRLIAAHLFGETPATNVPATQALAPSAFKLVGLYVSKDSEALAPADSAFASPGDDAVEGEVAPLEWARKFFGERLRDVARPGAIAWLSLSGAPGLRVQVGESIGGGKVLEIRDDGVTLELAGRRVRVAYPENPYVAMFRGESDRVTAVTDADSIPAELASKLLRFQPALGATGLEGFRLYPGSDAQAFVKSGLRAGDELEAIDGTPITSPRDMVPLLQAIKGVATAKDPVRVRLKRGSQKLDFIVDTTRAGARTAALTGGMPAAAAVPRAPPPPNTTTLRRRSTTPPASPGVDPPIPVSSIPKDPKGRSP